jgi:hypothetical protein
MENPKNYRILRNLKIILTISIPIYLISAYLTGIRDPIVIDGRIIEHGYYDHFTFLIIASTFLACLLAALHFFVPSVDNEKMEFGLTTVYLTLVLFGAVLLVCILSTIINMNNKWGEIEFFLVFITAVPLTISFFAGLLILAYGKFASLSANKKKKHRYL